MKKKFYVLLFGILCISALLLGFSYARESGTNQETFLKQNKEDNLRVVYSDNYISTNDSDGTDISIINRDRKETDVVLYLEYKEVYEDMEDVYYSVDNGDIKRLVDNKIELGTLSNYGTNGDHATYNVKLTSKSTDVVYFKMSVSKVARKSLLNMITASTGVYLDSTNNIRYYGVNVNNYIKFEDTLYRIVGEFGGKFRLVSMISDESSYSVAFGMGALLSKDDYLASFKTGTINEEEANSYDSWLKEQQFWLNDSDNGRAYVASAKLGLYKDDINKSHNNRYVREIDSNCYYVSGDGSINSPYEVTYGS